MSICLSTSRRIFKMAKKSWPRNDKSLNPSRQHFRYGKGGKIDEFRTWLNGQQCQGPNLCYSSPMSHTLNCSSRTFKAVEEFSLRIVMLCWLSCRAKPWTKRNEPALIRSSFLHSSIVCLHKGMFAPGEWIHTLEVDAFKNTHRFLWQANAATPHHTRPHYTQHQVYKHSPIAAFYI